MHQPSQSGIWITIQEMANWDFCGTYRTIPQLMDTPMDGRTNRLNTIILSIRFMTNVNSACTCNLSILRYNYGILIGIVQDWTQLYPQIRLLLFIALFDSNERESFWSTKFGSLDVRESSRVCSKEVSRMVRYIADSLLYAMCISYMALLMF